MFNDPSIDGCHSNLSNLLRRAPKYGSVSLRFRKTRVIECRCLRTITVIYCLFDAGLSIVGGHNEVYRRLRKLHNENDEFCALFFAVLMFVCKRSKRFEIVI